MIADLVDTGTTIVCTATAYVAAAGGIAALGVIAVYAAVRGLLRPHRARKAITAPQQDAEPADYGRCA